MNEKLTVSLATMPGIRPEGGIAFDAYQKPRKVRPRRRGDDQEPNPIETSELLLHAGSNPKLDYNGVEVDPSSARGMLKHYMGVFDRKTGDLQIVEVRPIQVATVVRVEKKEWKPDTATVCWTHANV
jgi:DNA-directed RNA polymerase I subunit RPA49